jgi:Zn-dependent M16 (insulinase) family peptidase
MTHDLPAAGTRLGHFLVTGRRAIDELNLTAVTLSHEPTGARLLHLACDDPNNVFAVGFRTPPPDSSGVAHILEHTVLCGSQKYPVRDPFFAMLKRSLNTFMNALTAADWTLYPVASMNRKDFYNLMGIYLDATFFPLLRELDFLQEGHRLEFDQAGNPDSLAIKGVVFNEMKGAMADPSSLLGRRLNAALFPTTCYGFNSGGEPLEIPQLSWQQLRDFHRSFYHPSNSWIFTYGDLPLEEHLEQIEQQALCHFDSQPVASEIPLEQRFKQPLRQAGTFPVSPNDDLSGRSMVQMAWLTCPIEDTVERAAIGILSNLLLGSPAAPLYQALIESGLGRNLSPGTGYHDDYRDTYLAAGLQGTDPDKLEQVEELVLSTLHRVARQGFPQERIDAALHQYEFSNREVTGDQYPYGLALMMRLFGPWLHADEPFGTLMIEDNLAQLRSAVGDPDFFPALIRRHLLDNPHRVTLLLQPDREHAAREEQAFNDHLAAVRETLDDASIRTIEETAVKLQQSQESVEDISCLPILDLADIAVDEPEIPCQRDVIGDCSGDFFAQPTNGISYLTLQFEIAGLKRELRRTLPLFCALLPQVGAAGHDYLAMSRRITAASGGIRLGTSLLDNPDDLDAVRPVVELKAKALERNHEQLCAIVADMLSAADFSDRERLRTVIGQVRTSLENSIPGAGHSFAARAASAGLTPAAALREEWSGMTQVTLIRRASTLDDAALDRLATQLSAIASHLFDRARLAFAVTAQADALGALKPHLSRLFSALPRGSAPAQTNDNSFKAQATVSGWRHNLPLAYVARAFRTVPRNHPDAPALLILAKLLRAEFLHREIREKGGAYGGMAGYNADGGILSMLSYRDPHLARTIDIFEQAAAWVADTNFDEETIRQAILSAFAELDRPLSPGGRGYDEFVHRRQGLSHAMRQQFRRRLLAVDAAQLTRVATSYLGQGTADCSLGILAGATMLDQAAAKLDELAMQQHSLDQ